MSKEFPRYNSHKLKKLARKWRKPRGLHNKVRLSHKGYTKLVKVGYGTAGKIQPLVVKNLTDIAALKAGTEIVVSSSLGQKKRLELIKKAEELKLKIINIKSDYAQKVAESMKQKKDAKAEKKKKKEQKQKEAKEKKPKKDDKESSVEDITEEEKKAEEKKEKDKLLTRKEGI
ncbi:hypothetical protein H6503_01490 [Candidatus Woesearchaeota archaeon]|nr:hypothetical protein [Candidatus Woesearchaeota archaeon]